MLVSQPFQPDPSLQSGISLSWGVKEKKHWWVSLSGLIFLPSSKDRDSALRTESARKLLWELNLMSQLSSGKSTHHTVQHTEAKSKMGRLFHCRLRTKHIHTWDSLNGQCYYTQTKRTRHCCNLQQEWRFKKVKKPSWNDFGWMHHI